jgi:hypothetical protein
MQGGGQVPIHPSQYDHGRGQEHRPDQGGIEQHGEGEAKAHLLKLDEFAAGKRGLCSNGTIMEIF